MEFARSPMRCSESTIQSRRTPTLVPQSHISFILLAFLSMFLILAKRILFQQKELKLLSHFRIY